MRIHSEIAALRSNPALQRRSQAAMNDAQEAWYKCDGVAGVREDLAAYGKGQDLVGLPALHAILSNHADSSDFIDQFCAVFMDALRKEPLGEMPMQHGSNAGFARLQLMRSGSALLSLCAYAPVEALRGPQTVQFIDCSVEEIVIAGNASGIFQKLDGGHGGTPRVTSFKRQWTVGDRMTLCPRDNARQLIEVGQTFLTLQLTRSSPHAQPSCEYRLSDGAMVQQSSGNKRASEQVMALSVLGALQHHGAIGPMEVFAQDIAHDPDARWEAVRQALAMNTERGIGLLEVLSNGAEDPLSAPASNLREQLMASLTKSQTLMAEAQ